MNKIIFILILSLFVFNGISEEIKVDTSKGEKTLIIPDDPDELREAYIDMALLFIEEKYSHDETLAREKELIKLNDDSLDKISILEANTDELLKRVDKKDIFKHGLSLGGGADFNFVNLFTPTYSFKGLASYDILLFEKVMIKSVVQFPPIGVGLMLGLMF